MKTQGKIFKSIQIYMFMFLFVLLQLFPLGLTGEYHTDPLYNKVGPRNITILSTTTPKDATTVVFKKNCGLIVDSGPTDDGWYYFVEVENDSTFNKRKFIIEDKEFFKLNLQNPFCVDSLKYW